MRNCELGSFPSNILSLGEDEVYVGDSWRLVGNDWSLELD